MSLCFQVDLLLKGEERATAETIESRAGGDPRTWTDADVAVILKETLAALSRHPWPGNVRELQNVIHRAILACRSDEITLQDLPPDYRTMDERALHENSMTTSSINDHEPVIPLKELERREIKKALRATNGSVGKAAKLLGIGRATLYRRLAELELPTGKDASSPSSESS